MDSIWVGIEDDNSTNLIQGFWVKVFYDVVPNFWSSCLHMSHNIDACKRRCSDVLAVKSICEQRLGNAGTAAEVFVKLPEPTLLKNTAPSSSSAGYSNNHRKKVTHSHFWKAIKTTGARNTLEQNTTQCPALSNSGMLQTVIVEDEKGLESVECSAVAPSSVASGCNTTPQAAWEANQGTFSSDLARVQGRVVEHCEEVQGSTASVMQQVDQDALDEGMRTVALDEGMRTVETLDAAKLRCVGGMDLGGSDAEYFEHVSPNEEGSKVLQNEGFMGQVLENGPESAEKIEDTTLFAAVQSVASESLTGSTHGEASRSPSWADRAEEEDQTKALEIQIATGQMLSSTASGDNEVI
ncbi:hypothetical protein LIER_16820 [Lithospermum erythrorhizon]|uniref:Uncharacterized protein n=1 Tax=Lithospermum erythrorhizon TaxID=34254 RepID=A0AAV3QAK4_LITER